MSPRHASFGRARAALGRVLLSAGALAGLGFCLGTGCGHPCRELSDRVCRCAQNAEQEAQCLRQVRSLASQDRGARDAQAAQTCAALLETCTCEALAAGDLAACGLATQGR